MKPKHNEEWKCKFAMWDGGEWICALAKFNAQIHNKNIRIPVRGCFGNECCFNPEGASDHEFFGECRLIKYEENGNKCPHCTDDNRTTFCTVGITYKSTLGRFVSSSDLRCNAWVYEQIGACPHYVESTPEEIASKLKVIARTRLVKYNLYKFVYRGNPVKWVTRAEEYAKTTVLSDGIKRLLAKCKK